MKLSYVTMTGADDGVFPEMLVELSKEYPFVEWGILCSRKQAGAPRFPSRDWVMRLNKLYQNNPMNLSLHLCGQYVRDLFKGELDITKEFGGSFAMFQRIQINTHGIPHQWSASFPEKLKEFTQREFIFQYDNQNIPAMMFAIDSGLNSSALFDLSHGAGVLAESWPPALAGVRCGYAGGLSVDNIQEQLTKISAAAGNAEVWIDMETHLRSFKDSVFDLHKVDEILKICAASGMIDYRIPWAGR